MKLVLANNQTEKFVDFYDMLREQSGQAFEYSGYRSLLFIFDNVAEKPVQAINLASGKKLSDYDGVYINGYLKTYELAVSVAIACDALGVPYVNKEMRQAPSLSKLSMYARLVAAGVPLPVSLAGSKHTLLQAGEYLADFKYPAILKRADADRGIDNYKVGSPAEIISMLEGHDDDSLWVVQEYIDNDGFYLVSFYDQKPVFCIFRSLEARPDGNTQKAHMYKPKGGANASLLELQTVPEPVARACQQAVVAMDRQIASVDCLYDAASGQAYVLEVNYNPQLVTIETFKDIRIQAFLDNLDKIA